MRWRKLLATAANLFRAEPRTKSSPDGLTERYADAMTIAGRLLREQRTSRRIMERRGVSQGRYDAACALLKACRLLVVLPGHAPKLAWGVDDIDVVDRVLSDWVDEQRARAREHRRYVTPLGGERG